MVHNVDDNILINSDKAKYCGLVRNFEENFEFAFYSMIVWICRIFCNAEIHTFKIGIKL